MPKLKNKNIKKTASSWSRKHVSTSRPPTTPFILPFLSLKESIAKRFCPSCTQLSSVQRRAQQWMTGLIFQAREDKVRGTLLLCWFFNGSTPLAHSSLVNWGDDWAQNPPALQTLHQRSAPADPQSQILRTWYLHHSPTLQTAGWIPSVSSLQGSFCSLTVNFDLKCRVGKKEVAWLNIPIP